MSVLARLFGKSPFAPLQAHLEKVSNCINQLPFLFEALEKADMDQIQAVSKKISKLEHLADLTKNDIRNHLPKSLFMPIDRAVLLEILTLQDSFADIAEDIAVMATFRPLDHYDHLKKPFENFCEKNIETFVLLKQVIKEFDALLETSFGGLEAKKVKEMIDELAFKEHELDKLQHDLIKQLYQMENILHYMSFYLWNTLIGAIGSISNVAEKLGNRIRMILELK